MPLRPFFSLMVSPPISTSPPSGTSSMLMQRSMVDLPEPDAPRIDTTSPSRALSDTPLRTSGDPKLLRRPRMATAGVDPGCRDVAPSDMGGLQARPGGRGAAQGGRARPLARLEDA